MSHRQEESIYPKLTKLFDENPRFIRVSVDHLEYPTSNGGIGGSGGGSGSGKLNDETEACDRTDTHIEIHFNSDDDATLFGAHLIDFDVQAEQARDEKGVLCYRIAEHQFIELKESAKRYADEHGGSVSPSSSARSIQPPAGAQFKQLGSIVKTNELKDDEAGLGASFCGGREIFFKTYDAADQFMRECCHDLSSAAVPQVTSSNSIILNKQDWVDLQKKNPALQDKLSAETASPARFFQPAADSKEGPVDPIHCINEFKDGGDPKHPLFGGCEIFFDNENAAVEFWRDNCSDLSAAGFPGLTVDKSLCLNKEDWACLKKAHPKLEEKIHKEPPQGPGL